MTPPNEAGTRALALLAKARDERPRKDDHALSEALRCLAVFRESVIASHRERPGPVGRVRLEHVNAVISSVLAVYFPLGEVPWQELDLARGWLANLVEQDG